MTKLVMGPFNRVEGDLEVRLSVADGAVTEAHVVSPLYRGFEQILTGRPPLDALTIAPRICGICSVSQSMATAGALRAAAGGTITPNGRLAAALVHAAENIADHLTHSFVFFLPDMARAAYADQPWHGHAVTAYAAGKGARSAAVLQLRARLLHVVGLLAGKWPHTLALQPGGTTVAADTGTKARLLAVLSDLRRGLEDGVYGAPLERIAALDAPDALAAYAAEAAPDSSDLRFFLHLADALGLWRLGQTVERYMAVGAYEMADGPLFAPGLWTPDGPAPLDPAAIAEDDSHAWMQDGLPAPDKAGAYTWCLAPRLDGAPVQVGALARQVIDGQPLARALLIRDGGGGVAARVLARHLEIARLVPAMEAWVRALRPHDPFCADTPPLTAGVGAGLVEAARGSLGHWLRVEHGRIADYRIIAPTTWNFAPRDADGVPGPLEQALVGTPVAAGDQTPVTVQHVVRSFDPCMVCTVH